MNKNYTLFSLGSVVSVDRSLDSKVDSTTLLPSSTGAAADEFEEVDLRLTATLATLLVIFSRCAWRAVPSFRHFSEQ